MADPTTALDLDFSLDTGQVVYPITSSVDLVGNAFISLQTSTGKVVFASDTAGTVPVGIAYYPANGTFDDGYVTCSGGFVIHSYAVTGASAHTDVGTYVYASDGQTLTTTKGSNNKPHGVIVKWISSTLCDVYIYKPSEVPFADATD